jgi:hypothetical protein
MSRHRSRILQYEAVILKRNEIYERTVTGDK